MEAVEEVARLNKAHAPGYDRVRGKKVWFQEGTIQFWDRELENAEEHLWKICRNSLERPLEIDLNTEVYSWLRLGQIYDLTGRRNQALDAYRKAISAAPQGYATVEAKRYLATPYRR